ncbi:MAG TPA: ABC transporter permease [Thermomicrobiales bacterium]|nr:ABC transporter permease [Thermomicrobiales bacterium]
MANVLRGDVAVRPATPGRRERVTRPLAPVFEMLRRDRFALTGVIIYAVIAVVAVLAPVLAPHDPHAVMEEDGIWLTNEKPSREFLLGTTNIGRDIFSQLIYGARPALVVGFTAAFFVVFIGTIVGLVAGYFGGWVDTTLMRITDVAFGIPFLPFVIVLVAFLQPSIWNIVLAMAILLWCDTARVIRSQVLTLRQRSYVQAAQVAGASAWRTMFVYIAPNILSLSLLYGTLAVGWAILTEAAVSFLGLGDPNVVSWGFMLQDAYVSQALARGAYYWFVPPGVCIMLTVMAGFFIGRGTEELLFPRLRER